MSLAVNVNIDFVFWLFLLTAISNVMTFCRLHILDGNVPSFFQAQNVSFAFGSFKIPILKSIKRMDISRVVYAAVNEPLI